MLLGRQPRFPPGRYSALAEFVEVGESLEAAVAARIVRGSGGAGDRRALRREPAVAVPILVDDRLPVFDGRRAIVIDTTELEDARWFSRAEVEAAMAGASDAAFIAPPPFAIAHSLLAHWLAA